MGLSTGSNSRWAEAWTRVEDALGSLMLAGWLWWDDDAWQDNDDERPLLGGALRRARSGIAFEFDLQAGVLTFLAEPVDGSEFGVVGEEAAFEGEGEQLNAQVEEWAVRCGLLGPTRVEVVDEDSDAAGLKLMRRLMYTEMLEPSALCRACSVAEAAAAWDADPDLSNMISWFAMAGADQVLPEVVPSAVALGIAAFCWRNNTAVEGEHHRFPDPVMAKTNIAAVRAVQRALDDESMDDLEAINWTAVEDALCDPDRRLGDGACPGRSVR